MCTIIKWQIPKFIYTYIYTNVPWIHKSVTRQQDVEQVIHICKNIHKFSVHKLVLQDIFTCYLCTLKIHFQIRMSVYLAILLVLL